MLCAISGEAPQFPVASRKSGTVYEKRLIEAYIQENGKDPVNGEELAAEDLVELKTARVVRPRPPALTSIPSLLSVFQNEWDALALETYTLKQHLSQLRQELSTALYNNDAAVRVIARLTRERDEARDALAKVSMQDRRGASAAGSANGAGGDAMVVDGPSLPADVGAKIDATQERLSRTRRKRPVPEGWATQDSLQSLDFASPVKLLEPGSRSLAVDSTGKVAVLGSVDGSSCTWSIAGQETLQMSRGDGAAITDALFWEQTGQVMQILATSSGEVIVMENGEKVASFAAHDGAVTALALHPCGDILASVGVDKSFVLYDLSASRQISRVFTDSELLCCQFHPDGHLFAAGSTSGQTKIFDVKTSANSANFDASGPVQSLSFSENGIWFAAAVRGSTSVGVYDLRKAGTASAEVKTLEFGGRVDVVRWDYTGQFLVGAGPACVAVQAYDKGSKSWSEPLRRACSATAVAWGAMARSLVVLNADGRVAVLQ